jgi:hypothetical protein
VTFLRMVSPLALIIGLSACGSSSPTTPTTTAVTRIITVSGDLAFGGVNFSDSPTRTFTIGNSGSGTLTFTSLSAVGGTGSAGFTASPTSGTVAAGSIQTVTVRFTPTIAQFYSNVLTVVGDQTSGNAAINASGSGINNTPLFARTGFGNTVFDMPTTVTRVRIQGTWNRTQTSNFIVHIGGRSVVNEILRDSINYEGTHLTTGGVVEIVSSGSITWTFTEVR